MFEDDKDAFKGNSDESQDSVKEGDETSAFKSDESQDTKGEKTAAKEKDEPKEIVTEFGTFKTPEELAAHTAKIIKDNQKAYTSINEKYQKVLLTLSDKIDENGKEKSDTEKALDYEILENVGGKDLVNAFKLLEGKQSSFQKDVIKALTDIGGQLKQTEDKHGSSELAIARSNPAYREHEADVNKFLEKNNYDVSQLISIWATDYPELKDYAGNKYLAGFKIWEMLSGKKTKDNLASRAETDEPRAGSGKTTYQASPEQKEVWKRLGITDPKIQQDILKARAAKAARRN